jgi:hypothetical protein
LEEYPESAPPLPPERAALYRSLDVTRRTSPRRAVATSRPVTVAAAMAVPVLYTFDENDDDDDGTIERTATAVVESTLLAPAVASTRMVTANSNQTGKATG